MLAIREKALKAIAGIEPAGNPKGSESKALMLASRTNGGRDLPPYYLVYFLLVDLLEYPNLGQWEKVAWIVPLRFRGRLYSIEHRKMGLGIFAPTHDAKAMTNAPPSDEAETDAREISALIKNGVAAAQAYFEWRAEQVAAGIHLNVVNNSDWLFDRYKFFLGRFETLSSEAEARKNEYKTEKQSGEGFTFTQTTSPSWERRKEAKWNAQAAIEAFFSWTEHVFIHLAILQGRLRTGDDVAGMAAVDWKTKFKAALDVNDPFTKEHYDRLLDLRAQIRNFMAHGAFGKRGEAFSFHSGAGAVPLLLTGRQNHRYSLSGQPAFDEHSALSQIDEFLKHLWSGPRASAREYIFSGLPSVLTMVSDGSYAQAMKSEDDMKGLVGHMVGEFDRAADMDW